MSEFKGIVDCDVHHLPRREEELVPYLPVGWQERAQLSSGRFYRPTQLLDHLSGMNWRLDAVPGNEAPAGSDYELMRQQLLDQFEISAAHLSWGSKGAVVDGEFATALCRAENRWCAEQWLEEPDDARLCAGIAVPMHDPDEAAAEIRRTGSNPRFASAHLTYHPFGRPVGHPIYHPIYAAAAEMGLPIYIHVNVGEHSGGTGPQISGGNHPNYRFDLFVTIHHTSAMHLTSMIMHGVFERFPTLKVLVAESGLAWLPGFFAALDSSSEQMRRESSWIRRQPSEYLRDHVFFTTQPCEASRKGARALVEHLSVIDGIEEMLCFSSDYPHWDNDTPTYIGTVFPQAWHDKILHSNARRVLRLPQVV